MDGEIGESKQHFEGGECSTLKSCNPRRFRNDAQQWSTRYCILCRLKKKRRGKSSHEVSKGWGKCGIIW